jgi:peptide-methionine (S)-S-oxide reductase
MEDHSANLGLNGLYNYCRRSHSQYCLQRVIFKETKPKHLTQIILTDKEWRPLLAEEQFRVIVFSRRRRGMTMSRNLATFAAGCFWGVEANFRKMDGVIDTDVGYTGGTVKDPDYCHVCTGTTGHVEAVQITFDADKISYKKLLEIFWRIHDPTTTNQQGPDYGSQYRSMIFYHDVGQQEQALKSMADLEKSGQYCYPIVTEIVPASVFYPAEEYHQHYYERHGL